MNYFITNARTIRMIRIMAVITPIRLSSLVKYGYWAVVAAAYTAVFAAVAFELAGAAAAVAAVAGALVCAAGCTGCCLGLFLY